MQSPSIPPQETFSPLTMTPTLTGAMAARLGMRSLVFRTLAASLATNVLLGCALLLRTPPALTILVPPGAGTTEDG